MATQLYHDYCFLLDASHASILDKKLDVVLEQVSYRDKEESWMFLSLLKKSLSINNEPAFYRISKVMEKEFAHETKEMYQQRVNAYGLIMQRYKSAKYLTPETIEYIASLGRPLYHVTLRALSYNVLLCERRKRAFIRIFEQATMELEKKTGAGGIYAGHLECYASCLNRSPLSFLDEVSDKIKPVILQIIAGKERKDIVT